MQLSPLKSVLVAAFILWASTLPAQTEDALLQQLSEIAEQSSPSPVGVNLQQKGSLNETYIV